MVKYNIVITAQAKRSLQQIHDYIEEERSVQAAKKVTQGIRDAIAKLAKNPDSNGPANDLNDENIIYRRVLVWNYRVIFRIEEDKLEVIVIEILNMKMSASTVKKRLGLG